MTALDSFSMTASPGEVVGIIGPNGAGKTTLFNVISGFLTPDSGEMFLRGNSLKGRRPHEIADLGTARAFQDLRLVMKVSVLDNVLLAMRDQKGENVWHALFNFTGLAREEAERRRQAKTLLGDFNLGDKASELAEDLSYGQQKLLSLACCIATGSKLLLLDEPVAGINPELIERIVAFIKGYKELGITTIVIEHNMDAVARVTDRVIVMDAGRKIAEGSHAEVIKDAAVLEAYLE